MYTILARTALNIFYYLGGFIILAITYFFIYNSNIIVYRILKAIGISKGPDRQFKSINDIRADMKLLIDNLYTLAGSADMLVKLGSTYINS